MSTKEPEGIVAFTVRLPEKKHAELVALGRELDRSVAWVIRRAIDEKIVSEREQAA